MSIESSNTFNSFRGVKNPTPVSVNGIISYSPVTKPLPSDNYSFKGEMYENLQFSKEKSISGIVFDGELNGKNTTLKTVYDENKNFYYEASIAGKKLSMIGVNNGGYHGKIGDKDFELNIDYKKPSKITKFINSIRGTTYKPKYFNISGTIGGKEVSISMPNGEIPKDEDEKDLYSLILFDNGCAVKTFGNKIIGIGYSNENQINIRRRMDNRDKKIDENVKPLIMQSVSTLASVGLGALLYKFGLKH